MAKEDARICTSISHSELERRWSLARADMKTAGLDALVIQGLNDFSAGGFFRWFTGQQPSNVYPRSIIFPLEGPMIAVENGPLGGEATLDPADPMTKRSEGKFEKDYTKFLKADALKGARIGVARDYMGADPDVDWIIESAVIAMKKLSTTSARRSANSEGRGRGVLIRREAHPPGSSVLRARPEGSRR